MTGPFSTTWASTCSRGRQAVRRVERPSDRSGAFRAARPRRRRAEVLLPLRGRSRGGISVLDIRPSSGATAGPRRAQLQGRHVSDRIRADGHGARARRAGHARRRFPRQGWPRRRGRPAPAAAVVRAPGTHPVAGGGAGRGELAGRRRRCAYVAVHGAGPAEVGDRARRQCGGYPGSPYFKITIAGTDRALAATGDGELVAIPAFTGGPEQLWRIDQLTDGTYRLMPKAVPSAKGTGAVRRRQQQADPRQIQGRQRSAAVAAQDAVSGSSRPKHLMNKPLLSHASAGRPAVAAGSVSVVGSTQDATARRPAPTLARPKTPTRATDAAGFLQRWLVLEPSARRDSSPTAPFKPRSRPSTSPTSSP